MTDNCYSLKMEIENAIKSGQLTHLVKNMRRKQRDNTETGEPSQKKIRNHNAHHVYSASRNTCNMIHRNASHKRTFTEAKNDSWKEEQVIMPRVKVGACSTAPLIITGVVGHYRTRYMFLDNGSSTDIMYQQCFDQLDDDDKKRIIPTT